jgi:hypothetical protein
MNLLSINLGKKMKKYAYLALVMLLGAFFLYSCKDDPVKPPVKTMSLELVHYDSVAIGQINTYNIKAKAIIKNVSTSEKEIIMKMEPVQMTAGHQITFCAWDLCYAPTDGPIVSNSRALAAGAETLESEFYSVLNDYGTPGTSKAKFTAYVKGDPEDKVEFYVTFTAMP